MRKLALLPLLGALLMVLSLGACQVSTPTPAGTPGAVASPTLAGPTAPGGRVEIVTATPTLVVLVTATPEPPTATAIVITATPGTAGTGETPAGGITLATATP